MLSRGLRLAAVVVMLATAPLRADEVSGAFGVSFGIPVPVAQLGAIASSVSPPAPFEWTVPEDAPTPLHPRWFSFTPTAVPRVLDGISGNFQVQLDADALPLRVVAQLVDACETKSEALAAILEQKYPRIAQTADEATGRWFGSEAARVGMYCSADRSHLVLDYVDVARYRKHEALTRDAYAVWQVSEAEAREAEALLLQEAEQQRQRAEAEEAERRRLADAAEAEQRRLEQEEAARVARRKLIEQIIVGSARRIDSVFGIRFRERFSEVASFTPDVAMPVTRAGMPPPFNEAHFVIELDPDGVPIRIRATARVAKAIEVADQLGTALREKHGAPMKDLPRHRIFDVSGDYLVVKQLGDDELELVAINQTALQIQRRRLREAAARIEADRARRFEQETKGL